MLFICEMKEVVQELSEAPFSLDICISWLLLPYSPFPPVICEKDFIPGAASTRLIFGPITYSQELTFVT